MLYILTLEEMKDALGIKDADDDAQVTTLLEGLQGRFDQECNRRFLYASSTEELFDGGQQWLLVRAYPIDAVASIHVDEDQEWDEGTLLDADDYRINKPRGRIVYGTGEYFWPIGFQHIRAIYSGGLIKDDFSAAPGADTAEIESLRRAARIQANFEWRNRQNLGASNVSVAGVSLALAKAELLPEVKAILNGLRRY
jgi:hypothetical protein